MSVVASIAGPKPIAAEDVRAAYARLEAELPAPDAGADAWEAWFWRWDDYRKWISGEGTRRHFRECQDTRDEAAAAAWRHMREAIYPISEEADGKLRVAFLAAACRAELEARLGSQLFAKLTLDAAGFAPENVALAMEDLEQVTAYDTLMGQASFDVDGEALTLMQVQGRLTDPDAGRRRAVWAAMGTWFEAHADRIHGVMSTLVALRDRQARQLGDPDFIPLAYRRMGRTEYGPAEVAAFREGVLKHVVPLTAEVRARQARDLGTAAVHGADMMYFPGASLGPDAAPVAEQMARARALFDKLDPRFAAHFRRMERDGLIDLDNRPGKKPGGFACSFEDDSLVAIYCNSTGAESDVSTLTHEMGHAIQAWESIGIRAMDVRNPTMDAAEIHSFGMEYLALLEIEAFFAPAEAAQYRRFRLMSTLTRLPYMCVVDAFQHWMYANPAHTPAEREAAWAGLWDRFMPGLDFADCPRQKTFRWMRQAHIFGSPFYYIDYALAEVAALQLWVQAQHDRAGATEAFMRLCRVGGTKALLGILAEGGLSSPFAPDALPPLVAAVRGELGF